MTKQAYRWRGFKACDIPSSLRIDPVLYEHMDFSSKVLDVGCGVGQDVLELYGKGYIDISGLDISSAAIAVGTTTARQRGIRAPGRLFVEADAEAMPFPDEHFDCVITNAFWTSILSPERERVMCEVSRILRADGILFATFWDQCWDIERYRRRYSEAIAQGLEKGSFEVKDKATGEVRYVAHHYTRDEVDGLLGRAGLQIAEYHRSLERTQSGNRVGCHVVVAKIDPVRLAPGSIKNIEIDGNDGTGKTTLCAMLEEWGIQARDRGLITKISLGEAQAADLRDDTLYVLLDAEPKISYSRLVKAGEDMAREYHTLPSLEKYRGVFREIYEAADRANVVLVDAGISPWEAVRQLYTFARGRLRDATSPALDGLGKEVVEREMTFDK